MISPFEALHKNTIERATKANINLNVLIDREIKKKIAFLYLQLQCNNDNLNMSYEMSNNKKVTAYRKKLAADYKRDSKLLKSLKELIN